VASERASQPCSEELAPVTLPIRRLDHVAILVADTQAALAHFRDRLGLEVIHSEELTEPRVLLTYLDIGNTLLQLLQPLDDFSDLAHALATQGEGPHHLCFGVDDPVRDARLLSLTLADAAPGTGRGRISAFVPGPAVHGVRLECTQFDRRQDVDRARGFLDRKADRLTSE
jgi:methylmalonyl-CoA/ethylmalonyl-CoA epimerase